MNDKDLLYSTIFNIFRENVINLSYINMSEEEYLDKLLDETSKDEDFTSFCLLRKYLKETKPVDTYDEIIDIVNVNNQRLRNKYGNIFKYNYLTKILNKTINEKLLKEDNNYQYFDSKDIYGNNKHIEKEDYIITINQDKYNLVPVLISLFNNYNLPFEFKVSKEDKLVILKVDNKNIEMYKSILDELNLRTIMIEKIMTEKKKPFQFIKRKIRK